MAQRRRMIESRVFDESTIEHWDEETVRQLGSIEYLPERVSSTCVNCGATVHFFADRQRWMHQPYGADRQPRWELCFPPARGTTATPRPEDAGGTLVRLTGPPPVRAEDLARRIVFVLRMSYGDDNVDLYEDDPTRIGLSFGDGEFADLRVERRDR